MDDSIGNIEKSQASDQLLFTLPLLFDFFASFDHFVVLSSVKTATGIPLPIRERLSSGCLSATLPLLVAFDDSDTTIESQLVSFLDEENEWRDERSFERGQTQIS